MWRKIALYKQGDSDEFLTPRRMDRHKKERDKNAKIYGVD